ncbi:filamentous hemagglutinin N-terminal domain-containing protein [Massilia sp. W12]|uniref:two-partner secretion domain-containing protein n=1 Tax=Massilia sp. W12 TaxID=3126507 RepID=UPI0030D4DABF
MHIPCFNQAIHPRPQQFPGLRLRLLTCALGACYGLAMANPQQPQVVHGQVNIDQQGKMMQITNSPNAIIDWQSFSIAAGETTRFIQQSANSTVLNRVRGVDPSQIFGALQSNGRVFLLNPNGILFGPSAKVDVHSLVASSLPMANEDFLRGKWQFGDGKAYDGKVINAGQINSEAGGQVMLIAPQVENSGIITSPQGEVMLAAGHSVQLVDANNPDMHVVVSASEQQALNLGEIVANAGKIGIYGALVKQQGRVSADSAQLDASGKVVFKSSSKTVLGENSVTSVRGVGNGGTLMALGPQIHMQDAALIDASGATGGGTVMLGGDFQANQAPTPNAQEVIVHLQAQILAKAEQSGVGGSILARSEGLTGFYGTADVSGIAQGGLLETSSGQHLNVRAESVRASGAKGGSWLLGMNDITVARGHIGVTTDGVFTIGSEDINQALNNGFDVRLQTNNKQGVIKLHSGDINNEKGGARLLTMAGKVEGRQDFKLSAVAQSSLSIDLLNGGVLSGEFDLNGGALKSIPGDSVNFESLTLRQANMQGDFIVKGKGYYLNVENGVKLDDNSSISLFNDTQMWVSDTLRAGKNGVIKMYGDPSGLLFSDHGPRLVLYPLFNGKSSDIDIFPSIQIQDAGSSIDTGGSLAYIRSPIIVEKNGSVWHKGSLPLTSTSVIHIKEDALLQAGKVNLSGKFIIEKDAKAYLDEVNTASLSELTNHGRLISKSIDNRGAILDITPGGPLGDNERVTLYEINGGVIKANKTRMIDFDNHLSLKSVSMDGDFELFNPTTVYGDLHLKNGTRLTIGDFFSGTNEAPNRLLSFDDQKHQSILSDGMAEINFRAAALNIHSSYETNLKTLKLNQGISLTGNYQIVKSGNLDVKLINQAIMRADAENKNIIRDVHLQQDGEIVISAGASFDLSESILHAGNGHTINYGNLRLSEGFSKLGQIKNHNTIDLNLSSQNQSIDLRNLGASINLSGKVQGGEILANQGSAIHLSNLSLDNVELGGMLQLSGAANVLQDFLLKPDAQLHANALSLQFQGGQTHRISSPGQARIQVNTPLLNILHTDPLQLQIDHGVSVSGAINVSGMSKGALLNYGQVTLVQNSDFSQLALENHGKLVLDGASLKVNNSLHNMGSMVLRNQAELHTQGNTLHNQGMLSGSGVLNLVGSILHNTGTIAPGDESGFGRMQINGNLNLQQGGMLQLTPALSTPGVQLGVSGDLQIDGLLRLRAPAGDVCGQCKLLEAGGQIDGRFSAVQISPELRGDLRNVKNAWYWLAQQKPIGDKPGSDGANGGSVVPPTPKPGYSLSSIPRPGGNAPPTVLQLPIGASTPQARGFPAPNSNQPTGAVPQAKMPVVDASLQAVSGSSTPQARYK